MKIEDKYSTGKRRILAMVLDSIILMVPIAMMQQVNNIGFIVWFMTLYSIVPVLYSILCHYKYGCTLGKSVLNIKVVDNETEEKITLKQAIYRDSIWLFTTSIGIISFILVTLFNIEFDFGFNFLVKNFDNTWALLELTTMLMNKKRRALHDFIANTVVIKTNSSPK